MISTTAECEVAIRNVEILEKTLESLRSQLAISNPKLFSTASEPYLRRIASHRADVERYRNEHPEVELSPIHPNGTSAAKSRKC
jgi:hypothetical protein